MQAPTSALLLRRADWNKERLIEQYMDDPTKVLVASGVQLPEPRSTPGPSRTTRSTSRSTSKPAKPPSPKRVNAPFVCAIPGGPTTMDVAEQDDNSSTWERYQ